MSAEEWYLVVFSIATGASVLSFWILATFGRRIASLAGGRRDFGFHVAAELLTAGLLLKGGIALAIDASWARPVLALGVGALLYTLLESPGHYLARGQRGVAAALFLGWPFAIAAAVLLTIAD